MAVDLIDSLFLITGKDPQRFGTGFAIHQDRHGVYLVTCAHVIEDVGGAEELKANGYPISLLVEDPQIDLAILRTDASIGIPLLPLSLIVMMGQPFYTTGCYNFGGKRMARRVEGILHEEIIPMAVNRSQKIVAWELAINELYQLEPGYSGAPVMDERGYVVGVISHRQGVGKKGLAISVRGLQAIWPDMPTSLFVGQAQAGVGHEAGTEPRMNFVTELPVFEKIANGQDTTTQLILVRGPSGMGKTHLLREYVQMAKTHQLNELWIDLGPQMTVENCFDAIIYAFGIEHFASVTELQKTGHPEPFTREKEEDWQRTLTRTFFTDLTNYRAAQRLVILFDQYEKADRSFRNWLNNMFLPGIRRQPLIVVVAGQENLERSLPWLGQREFHLNGFAVDWYHRYAHMSGISLNPILINEFHKLLHGCPKQFVDYVQSQVPAQAG